MLRSLFIILYFLGIFNYSYGNSKEATSYSDNTFDTAKLYYNRGIDFGRNGQLDSALLFTQKSVHILESKTPTDTTLLAYAYQSLGIINKLLGQYDQAIKCYNKSEHIYKVQNNTTLLGYIYGNQANIYYIQQDFSKAQDYHLMALNIFREDSLSFINQLSLTYNNLGNIYRKKRDFKTAISYYQKSLTLSQSKNSKLTAISNLALCYYHLRDNETSKKYYLKAINLSIKNFGLKNIKTASSYLNFANFLSNQNQEEKALSYYYKATQIYTANFGTKHPSLSNSYNDLGEHYLKNNQLDSALYYFQQSLIALSSGFDDTYLTSNPGIQHVLSKTHLLKALKNKAYALSRLAEREQNVQHYKLSLETYELAIETITKIRAGYISEESKLFLADNEFETFSNALETSYRLYSLTHEEKYIGKAFNYSESGKAAVLSEALKTSNALNIGGITDSLIRKEKNLEKSIWNYEELIYEEKRKKNPDENKLGYWNKYLFEKKQEYDQLTRYLENNFKKYYELKHADNTIKIEDIQDKISKKDVLIEYFLVDDKIYSFLIGHNFSKLFEQSISATFYQKLDSLLESLSNNNFSNHGYKEFMQYHNNSYYIYAKLLQPYEKLIAGKNLIIIPDGMLAYLPFEVLTTHNNPFKRINYKELPYLLYNHHFNYSYSTAFLFDTQHQKQVAIKGLGAFAPTYNNLDTLPKDYLVLRQEYREKLFPLKGIKVEVEKVAELLRGDQFLDNEANERTFKKVAADYDILHLAMHTIVNDKNPMYSKMAFTQQNDSTEDGFLNTYELYNMKLNSRMAVLSSCNSGSGKLHRGEGVMSLARGFIYSGCPSIVMTLWSVEDKSGVKLMTSFYKNLILGKLKSESIQLSKIEFIENADQLRAHPYFWSGYVVIGNNSALFHSNTRIIIFLVIGIVLLIVAAIVSRKKISRLFKRF